MNAVENLLRQGLESDPEDNSVRMELAEKLLSRGAVGEIEELLTTAPVAADSAEQMHRFLEIAAEAQIGNNLVNDYVEKYVGEHPADGWGHHVYALGLSRAGDDERARRHYEAAKKLNPATHDPDLEAALADDQVKAPHPFTAAVSLQASDLSEGEVDELLTGIDDVEVPVAEAPVSSPAASAEETAVKPARSMSPPEQETEGEPQSSGEAAEAAPVALAEREIDESVEVDGAEGRGERGLLVGEGEMVHAAERQADTKEKVSAMVVAILVHIVLILGAVAFIVAQPMKDPPLIVGNQIANLEDKVIETVEIEKKKRQAPTESAAARVEVTTVVGASSVAIPEITTDMDTLAPIGIGDSLGMSMSLSSDDGGGMVSFFGARSSSKKVVFVVDY